MKRRALLGSLATLAVAGCTGRPPADTTLRPTTRTTGTPTTGTTATTGDPPDATPRELRTLGVPATESDCPLGERGRAVCHPAQSGSPLALTPADDALELPADSTTFTLANDTDHEYRANFYGWSLSKRQGDRWFHVAPQVVPQPLHSLPPGESHDWAFGVDNRDAVESGPSDDETIALAGLGGGAYAFAVEGWFRVEDGAEPFYVAAGARFTLEGGQVELTPTEGVSSTRSGDRVVVTAGDEPEEGETMARLRARQVGQEGVPPNQPIDTRITEQLLRPNPLGTRPDALRNALAFFEGGVETVAYEAPTGDDPPFGVESPLYLAHDGEVYEVATERVE